MKNCFFFMKTEASIRYKLKSFLQIHFVDIMPALLPQLILSTAH